MNRKMLKNYLLCVLLSAFFCTSTAYPQDALPCVLKLNIVSFIEGTTDVLPVEGASVTLVDLKTKKAVKPGSISDLLFNNLKESEYKVSASRTGYRTSIDTFQLNCSRALQGTFNYSIAMWEGPSDKTVVYTTIDEVDKITGEEGNSSKPGGAPVMIGVEKSEKDNEPKGLLNSRAVVLAKPDYPSTARAVGASGEIHVRVLLDEEGFVVAAKAVSGHPLLRSVSELAAKASKFTPTLFSGKPVKISGIIVYNFR